jgi:hypothetical protein
MKYTLYSVLVFVVFAEIPAFLQGASAHHRRHSLEGVAPTGTREEGCSRC